MTNPEQKTKTVSAQDQQGRFITLNQASTIFKNYLDMPVWQLRHLEVSKFIDKHHIKNILDIGCAQGTLINRLSRSNQIQHLIGIDFDKKVLQIADQKVQPQLMQDSVQYQRTNPLVVDLYNLNILEKLPIQKFKNIELVTLIQFIQHIALTDLPAICEQIFKNINAPYAIITTPNKEFNVHFNFKEGQMRHPDHLYQWTRKQFQDFCMKIREEYGYQFEIFGIGQHVSDDKYGHCSQGAFFTRKQTKQIQNITNNPQQLKTQYIPQPYISYTYPFWKDRLQQKIQNQITNLLIKNNYQSPQNLIQKFKNHTKIGKKLTQQQKQTNIQLISQRYDINWIIQKVSKMKYCGYEKNRNQLYYQYESSSCEDEEEDFGSQKFMQVHEVEQLCQ